MLFMFPHVICFCFIVSIASSNQSLFTIYTLPMVHATTFGLQALTSEKLQIKVSRLSMLGVVVWISYVGIGHVPHQYLHQLHDSSIDIYTTISSLYRDTNTVSRLYIIKSLFGFLAVLDTTKTGGSALHWAFW